MRVAVLGELCAEEPDGAPVVIGTPKERTLLAALALRAGRVVPLDHLVNRLWGSRPPASAVATLRTAGCCSSFCTPDQSYRPKLSAWPSACSPSLTGDRTIHRLSRRGNRQLNHAMHLAALSQIRYPNTEGRIFYDRKIAEGRTTKDAFRALKRRISDAVFRQLRIDAGLR